MLRGRSTRRTMMASGGSSRTPPPLDIITGAVAAFSLRRLRTAYVGNAVTVRRSSDSTSQDIGFSGNDFDVAGFNTFVGGGSGSVSKWYDQSGNGRNITSTTFANQPVVTLAATPSGRPALACANTSMGIGDPVVPAATIPLTLSTVVTRTGGLTSFSNVFGLSGGANPPALFYQTTPGIALGNSGLDSITAVVANNQFHSAIGSMNGASSSLTVDGATVNGTLANQPGATTILFGFGVIGSFCEGIYFSSLLSAANIAVLGANQKSYWGTP